MKKIKGFTLIELLVVIAIIGILSSVVLASLNSARTKSRDARRISDVKQLQLALELYFDDNSGYPVAANYAALDLVAGGYIASMPADPTSGATYEYEAAGATSYCLGTNIEGNPPAGSTQGCLPGGGATDELPAGVDYAVSP